MPTFFHGPRAGLPLIPLRAQDISPAWAPATGQVLFTGFSPSVDITVAPGVGSVVLTGFAPDVTALAVAPGAGAVAIAGFPPSADFTVPAPVVIFKPIPPPPTRLLNWQQMVLEEDPDWAYANRRPWVLEFSNARRFYARDPLYAPYPDGGLFDNSGTVQLTDASSYPTSPYGLSAGALWNNSGVVTVVPGGMLQPGTAPLFFTGLTASQLLRNGGANLPTDPTSLLNDQIWNDNGVVSVAMGGVVPPPAGQGGGIFTSINRCWMGLTFWPDANAWRTEQCASL